jgi:endonuclease-3 related protein
MKSGRRVRSVYETLLRSYGRQHWWPAENPFEVCVGAILTQSTSWGNVEKAMCNLRSEGILSPDGLGDTRVRRLAHLIKPSLYYNVKARKLKEFVRFLCGEYGGKVEDMVDTSMPQLRRQLLGVWGLGPETVDSILLYALNKPSFVVDAYTRRIFSRLGFIEGGWSYDEIKGFLEANLPADTGLYNEYHALIVEHGKNTCKTKPLCGGCCLRSMCGFKPV